MKVNKTWIGAGLAALTLTAIGLVIFSFWTDTGHIENDEVEVPVATVSPDTRLPDNWHRLERIQKIELNYHQCLPSDTISQDNGRCLIDKDPETGDFDDEFEAEYIYISHEGPQAGAPLARVSYIYAAVPDDASNEQVKRVFDNYTANRRGFDDISKFWFDEAKYEQSYGLDNQLAGFVLIIYNYSDVEFDDHYFHGRNFTDKPRIVYVAGPGGVAYDYNGVVATVFEAGRDGSSLPEDCIAVDLAFGILSQPTVDQLQAYYSADSPFRTVLSGYLKVGGGYNIRFPESAYQKRLQDDINYDVQIKLYQVNLAEHYSDLGSEVEYSELNRHPELPSIFINGCR